MRFRKFDIPNPHPWKYPSQYPYFNLEGSSRPLSEREKLQIKTDREAWCPSRAAHSLFELLKSSLGKKLLLQVQNPANYYDTPNELPEPFVAELKDVTTERVLDGDIEFDQLFVLLSNPRLMSGESIFNEYNYDYHTLLKPQEGRDYRLNFSAVVELSVEQVSFWKQFFKSKNGS